MDTLLRAQELAAGLPETSWYLGDWYCIQLRHAFAISPRPGERLSLQVHILS
jgi:hypothetical protein